MDFKNKVLSRFEGRNEVVADNEFAKKVSQVFLKSVDNRRKTMVPKFREARLVQGRNQLRHDSVDQAIVNREKYNGSRTSQDNC